MSSIDAGSVLRERLIFLRSPYLYVCPAIFALYVAVWSARCRFCQQCRVSPPLPPVMYRSRCLSTRERSRTPIVIILVSRLKAKEKKNRRDNENLETQSPSTYFVIITENQTVISSARVYRKSLRKVLLEGKKAERSSGESKGSFLVNFKKRFSFFCDAFDIMNF